MSLVNNVNIVESVNNVKSVNSKQTCQDYAQSVKYVNRKQCKVCKQ